MVLLIVEDERWEREGLVDMVSAASLPFEKVVAAQDGVAGLEAIRAHRPQIVVTDVRMPGLSGLDMLKKAGDLLRQSVCVILTGYSEFEYARSAIKMGVADYLLKPVTERELTQTLRRGCELLCQRGAPSGKFPAPEELPAPLLAERDSIGETEEYVLRRSMQIISGQFSDAELNLRRVAACVYLSPNYVGALFKKLTGMTFSEYLFQYRMKVAAEMLKEPGRKISWIARNVGVPNTSYFSMLFRSAYGITPSEYRRRVTA